MSVSRQRLVPKAPPPTTANARAAMRGNKRSNTKPEMAVRRLLHSLGYRYRLHCADLPGKPDIVFRSRRKAIFVHGCFWHQHPDPNCPLRSRPRTNTHYWHAKLDRNIERDARHRARIAEIGWEVLVVWECETEERRPLEKKLCTYLGYGVTARN